MEQEYHKQGLTVENPSNIPCCKRDVALEKRLGDAFVEASRGNISIQGLCYIAETIRAKIRQEDKEGWDDPLSYLLLKDAVDEIETLHDEFVRAHYQQHLEKFLVYAEKLYGHQQVTFSFCFPQRVKVDITYLPE